MSTNPNEITRVVVNLDNRPESMGDECTYARAAAIAQRAAEILRDELPKRYPNAEIEINIGVYESLNSGDRPSLETDRGLLWGDNEEYEALADKVYAAWMTALKTAKYDRRRK